MNMTWKVLSITVLPTHEQKKDVVIAVKCGLSGVEETYKASTEIDVPIKINDQQPFIDYQWLTEEKVLEWVKTQNPADVQEAENRVAEMIENQKNPPVVAQQKPLPWVK